MRLFVAVNLPDATRRDLYDAADPLREAAPDLAWVTAPRLHLTVKFLGECADDAVQPLVGALNAAAARHAAFDFDLSGVGAFPNFRRPRVVWVGIERAERLELLQHDVEVRCAELGYEVEGRPFRPHLTLARVRRPLVPEAARSLARAARAAARRFQHEVSVTSIDLMQSVLGPGGSRYEMLHAAPLRAVEG